MLTTSLSPKLNSSFPVPKNIKPSSNWGSKKSKYGKKKSQKKNLKPVVTPKGPVKEYISGCCSISASKPRTGRKEAVSDPESKKMKEASKGLGHWRCSGCGKSCKVTPRMPVPKEIITAATPLDLNVVVVDMQALEERILAGGELDAPAGS